MQVIGFASNLVPLVKDSSKTLTYRLGDKYAFLKAGDEISTKDSGTGEVFGKLKIKSVEKVSFADLPIDREGHEKYSSKDEQRKVFEQYYGKFGDEDIVTILGFTFSPLLDWDDKLRTRFFLDKSKLEQYWLSKNPSIRFPHNFISETGIFKEEIEEKWNEKEAAVTLHFEELTGLKLEGEFIVSVLHPSFEIAQYVDERNIEWGLGELYPNSIVIGLAHELLHCLTHSFYSALTDHQKWIFHALVYLAVDEELRFQLNGKTGYFSSPVIDTYHNRLIQTAKMILPYWEEYVRDVKNKNIFTLFEKVSQLKTEE